MSRMIKDPNGRVFESIRDFVKFYNLNEITTRRRINLGWDIEIYREKNIKNFKQYVKLIKNDGYDERIINENLLLMGLNEYITLIKVRC